MTTRMIRIQWIIATVLPLWLASCPTLARETCAKSCLEDIANQYRAAYVKREPASAPISPRTKFTENNVEMKFPDGSWDAITAEVGPALTFSDPVTGNVGFTTAVMMNDTPGFLAAPPTATAPRTDSSGRSKPCSSAWPIAGGRPGRNTRSEEYSS